MLTSLWPRCQENVWVELLKAGTKGGSKDVEWPFPFSYWTEVGKEETAKLCLGTSETSINEQGVFPAAGTDHRLGQEKVLSRTGLVSRLVQSNWRSVSQWGPALCRWWLPGDRWDTPVLASGNLRMDNPAALREGIAFSSRLLPPADRPREGELRDCPCRAPTLLPTVSQASRTLTALPQSEIAFRIIFQWKSILILAAQ